MEDAIVISFSLINRLKNMPREECLALFDTLLCDEILKTKRNVQLTPLQELMYMMIHDYVMKDSQQYAEMRGEVAARV
jgi:hypothetical protein